MTYLSGVVLNPECPADVAVFRFVEFFVLFVLDFDFLDVGLGEAAQRALDV